MELIILGSGTSVPMNDRASPSLALMVDSVPTLFDIGPGTLRQLTKVGVKHEKIGMIFLTHFHPDHTADLVHFLFSSRDPSILKKRTPFVICGPSGLKKFIYRLQKAYNNWLTLPEEIMSIEEFDVAKKSEKTFKDFKIIALPTNHTQPSIAYRVESPTGKSFVYSGDTGFCQEIVELSKEADLVVLECSFPDTEEVEGHLTPYKAGLIAGLAGTNRLVLTHFYPQCLRTDITAQCRRSYRGELILGSDLMHIKI